MTDTSWVKPGAYFLAGRTEHGLTHSTVRTVAKLSFTVDGFNQRFRLRDMRTKTLGGAWGFHYRAVHPGGEEAARIAEAERHERLKSAAFSLLHNDVGDLAKVDAAIAALTAWRFEITGEAK